MKNKALLIGGSSVILLFALFAGCDDRRGEKEYNKAIKSWKKGDLSRAQGEMESAIRKLSIREKKSIANNQLGLILWALEKNDQATSKFEESCALSENMTGANLNYGISLFHSGQTDKAEIEFLKIKKSLPKSTISYTFLGIIQMQKKDWKKGVTEITTGLTKNPSDPAAQNALALAQLHAENSSKNAIKRLNQLLSVHPEYTPAIYNLAVIYDLWLKDTKNASSWYKKYLQVADENDLKIHATKKALARIERRNSVPNSTTSNAQISSTSNYIAEGSKLHSEKKYSKAIEQYRLALQSEPKNKIAHYNMGLSYYSLKQYESATKCYIEALKINPRDINARYMLALTYCQQNKWSDATREAKYLKSLDAKRGSEMERYIESAKSRN